MKEAAPKRELSFLYLSIGIYMVYVKPASIVELIVYI